MWCSTDCMGYFIWNCAINAQSSYLNKTAVVVIISMRSLVSIEQQSPRRPCDILVANVGPEIAKTAKTAKCAKKCAKLKMFKNSTFRGKPTKFLERSVPECSVCVRVLYQPAQAYSGPEALSSLHPAFSSWLPARPRTQETCPAVQRPRESTYHSGSFPEKLQGPGALTVPRGVPRRSTWPYSPLSHRNCAQDWKYMVIQFVFRHWKHLKKL